MNRRNLLKSIFYIPLAALGMNKTLAALAAPAKGITNIHGDTELGLRLNGKFNHPPKSTTGVDPVAGLPNAWLCQQPYIKDNLVVVEKETFYFPEKVKMVWPYKNGYSVLTDHDTYIIQRTDVGFYTRNIS